MPRTIELAGRVAVITGASSGIGAATARRLAAEGMDLALGARSVDKLEALADELEGQAPTGVEVLAHGLDVRDWNSTQAFAAAVQDRFEGVDLLFANAGTGGYGAVADLDVEAWNDTIATNLTGAFYTAKAITPLMTDRAGRGGGGGAPGPGPGPGTVLFTASVSGTTAMPGASAYCASKWGLRGFAQSLALELADHGIRTTAINPGYVATDWHAEDPRAKEMIQPEEIAELVVTLATLPENAMIDDVTVWPAKMYSE